MNLKLAYVVELKILKDAIIQLTGCGTVMRIAEDSVYLSFTRQSFIENIRTTNNLAYLLLEYDIVCNKYEVYPYDVFYIINCNNMAHTDGIPLCIT